MIADDALHRLGLLVRVGGGDGFARHLGDDPGQHLLVAEQREEGVVGVPIILHRDADMQPDRLDGGAAAGERLAHDDRSEEHTSELQSLMRTSYTALCLKKKTKRHAHNTK